MTYSEELLKQTYRFKDASPSEDAAIQQFLIAVQDLPLQNTPLSRFIHKTFPVVLGLVFAICLYASFTSGPRKELLLLMLLIIGTYGIQLFKVFRQKWDAAGIHYDFRKYSGHFLIGMAVCNQLTVSKNALGRPFYRVGVSIGKQSLADIPVIKSHYQTLRKGEKIFIIAAQKPDSCFFFAVPQALLKRTSSKQKEMTSPFLVPMRPIADEERRQILLCEKDRIQVRRRLYLQNQLIVTGIACVFLLYEIFRVNEAGITLGAFLFLCCLAIRVYNFFQDMGYRRPLKRNQELLCADASAHPSKTNGASCVQFQDADGHIILSSSLKDDIHWFEEGDRALLVYYSPKKPIAYNIRTK